MHGAAWRLGLAWIVLAPGLLPAVAAGVDAPVDLVEPAVAGDLAPPGLYDAGAGTRGAATWCDGAAKLTVVTKRGGGPALPGIVNPRLEGAPAGTVKCGHLTVNLVQGAFRGELVTRVYRWTACVGGGQGTGSLALNGTKCRDAYGNVPFREATLAGTVGMYQTTYCAPTYCALTMVVMAGPKPGDAAGIALQRR